MEQEDKAKRFDEIIKRIRGMMPSWEGLTYTGKTFLQDLTHIIPELRESEDELTWLTKYIEEEAYSLSMDIRDNEDRIKLEKLRKSLAWLEKQGEQKENATRDKIAAYLKNLILDQSQRGFPMIYYEGRVEEELDFIINIAKEELKKEKQSEHQKPAHKEYTFTAIPRLLEMIQPSEKAKSYCQKLIDSLEQEGYSTDANIVRERLMLMNGEEVAMATMDEQKSAWSEEDEIGHTDALWAIEQARTIAKDENDMGNLWYAEKWLKSLKDRVQPQPKQEWSERDKEEFQIAIDTLVEAGQHDSAQWLKSLNPLISSLQQA